MMSKDKIAELGQQLLQSSFVGSSPDHYMVLLAQRIVLLEQQLIRSAAVPTLTTLQLSKQMDFIATENYPSWPQVVDEEAQKLLQKFVSQSADATLAQAYMMQLRQHLDGLEQQYQYQTQSTATHLTCHSFITKDLPDYNILSMIMPACFVGFWAAVSPSELSEHSQKLWHEDILINVYPFTLEQRAEAKALLQTFTPAQCTAVAGLCHTLQRVYRLKWQRDFKPLVFGSIL